jgi:hypothetical protein
VIDPQDWGQIRFFGLFEAGERGEKLYIKPGQKARYGRPR